MARRSLALNPPYREIEYADGKKKFWNRLKPKSRIDLSYLVETNIGKRFVIVYEIEGDILGFIVFVGEDDHLYLDLIEWNEIFEESRGVEFSLMILLEAIAANFGYSRIILYSTGENIGYYEALGYEIAGNSFDNPDYGMLTPMGKIAA
ncbi:MAG: hypothetical protein KGI33_07390 [Thaumarchaeota archaeon]|nr:hypothetical protein [Nitrososphaerota archaeon]